MSEESWLDAIEDEDLRGNESLVNIPDVPTLAKNYLETKKMVGNALHVPSEDANEDQVRAFHQKVLEKAPGLMLKPNLDEDDARNDFFKSLGVPDDPSKYEEVAIENHKFDEVRDGTLRKLAHEAGLTPTQFKQVMGGILEFDRSQRISAEETNMEAMKELKLEWGMAYDDKKKVADKVRDTFLPFIPEGQMDAQTIKALNAIGDQLLDSGDGIGDLNRGDEGDKSLTPADAKARIDEIMNNPEHAYWNRHAPGHKDAIEHMVDLQAAANPGATRELKRAGFSS